VATVVARVTSPIIANLHTSARVVVIALLIVVALVSVVPVRVRLVTVAAIGAFLTIIVSDDVRQANRRGGARQRGH
jgi:hypothetical protein